VATDQSQKTGDMAVVAEGAQQGKGGFRARCERIARAVATNPAWVGKAVVLVSHGAVVSAIIRTLTGIDKREAVRHTAMTELRMEGAGREWKVVPQEECGLLHSLAHLPPELRTS
jgi:broad specificity phosphatase PhoE